MENLFFTVGVLVNRVQEVPKLSQFTEPLVSQ